MPTDLPDLFGFAPPAIAGLRYIADFIDHEAERQLMARVDAGTWNTTLQRRTQHYGRRYDDPAAGEAATAARPLPDWLQPLCIRLQTEGLCDTRPDRVSINEYLPGQGIAPHIDAGPELISTIMILSLSSPCVMEFTHPATGRTISRLLERRSLNVIAGEARHDWLHGIPKRRSDIVLGARIVRGRRVSLMFRALYPPR
jgi:alkylated DNA repair dioxygenase AlkB